jgi:hypothetical protein
MEVLGNGGGEGGLSGLKENQGKKRQGRLGKWGDGKHLPDGAEEGGRREGQEGREGSGR